MLNANLLKGKMIEKGFTQTTLAIAICMSENTLSSRLNGKSDFRIGEIDKICEVLRIDDGSQKAKIFLA